MEKDMVPKHSFLGCLLLLLIALPSYSHEGRPVYIEILEMAQGQYQIFWKIPPILSHSEIPQVAITSIDCHLSSAPTQPSLVGHAEYRCDNAIELLSVALNYPQTNPSLSSFIKFRSKDGETISQFFGPSTRQPQVSLTGEEERSLWVYFPSGIDHIFAGWDHLLFVLCLIFLCTTWRKLIVTLTGFTIAHTFTLIASTLNWYRPPIIIIEALIALSIVFLAAEILRNRRQGIETWMIKYPFSVAFLFGLIHGFGFANVLADFGLPQDDQVSALLLFNLGVEAGQVMFVVFCLALSAILNWIVKRFDQNKYIYKHTPTLILFCTGSLSGYWFIERITMPFLGLA